MLPVVEPAKTGSGGAEPLNIKLPICGTRSETGSGGTETGSGGTEKLIAPLEPPTESTAHLVPPIAPSEPATESPAPIAPQKIKVGDRVKIAEDYGGQETLKGIEATVREDWGKGDFAIEFDSEMEILGGRPKKILGVSADFLAIVMSAEGLAR